MIDHSTFSALRSRHLFPMESKPDPERRSFDEEYMGGLWDEEYIAGVTLRFPKRGGNKVGIVEAAAGPYVDATAVEGHPTPFTGPFVDPAWVANANKMLEAVGLAVRIGDGEMALRPLAAGNILKRDFSDGGRSFLFLACRAPDLYHMEAVVHATEGLLRLVIRRPDLVKANDRDNTYDALIGGLHDEGEE
jgi:hypothetical protein